MTMTFHDIYIIDVKRRFEQIKSMADKALNQLRDEELFKVISEESNCIAVLMKHLAGNMIHRWTNLHISEDEKPKRNRDREFVIDSQDTKERIYDLWERGWHQLFRTINGMSTNDLTKTIEIRWRKYTLIEALNRQLVHYSLHVGQIIYLSKYFRGKEWESLSIPKGESKSYNESLRKERLGL